MKYYDARQRKDGRWEYTYRLDKQIFPAGYCAGYPTSGGLIPGEMWNQEMERLEPFRSKFHIHGHATEAEARECYRQYLLDLRLNLNVEYEAYLKCIVCETLTNRAAMVDRLQEFVLCDEHRTREEVEKRLGIPGIIVSS